MRQIYLSILLLISLHVEANTDELIEITEDGKLIGLPLEYLPANFNMKSYSLQIGKNKVRFPECVSKYFNHAAKNSIIIRSSWFSKRVPYYIHMQIQPEGKDYLFRLTFDLKTLLPMSFEISTPYGNPSSTGYRASYNHELKIQDYCLSEFKVESV